MYITLIFYNFNPRCHLWHPHRVQKPSYLIRFARFARAQLNQRSRIDTRVTLPRFERRERALSRVHARERVDVARLGRGFIAHGSRGARLNRNSTRGFKGC